MPGLNYSPDQLFFISYAQLWCSTPNIKKLIGAGQSQYSHSPGELR